MEQAPVPEQKTNWTLRHKVISSGLLAALVLVGLGGVGLANHNQNQSSVKGIAITKAVPSPTPSKTPTPSPSPTPSPTRVPTKTPIFVPTQASSQSIESAPAENNTGLSNNNYYENSSGNEVHSPANSNNGGVPAGATAQCGDGTYSFSQHHSGTCSHHGGVAQWF
jgi:hypothetical protein